MAMKCTRLRVWVSLLVLFTCLVSLVCSSSSPQTDGKVRWLSFKGLFRNKREVCVDGSYDFNGRKCCKCGVGQALVTDCVKEEGDRKCRPCDKDSYNDEPNYEKSCKPCASCDQGNANLEVHEPCTFGKNTICRCKKDHYCVNRALDRESCLLCNPCKVCGPEGIKTACTATNNTVCNKEGQPGTTVLIVFGVLLLLAALVAALVGGALFFRRKISSGSQEDTPPDPDRDTLLLKVPQRSPYLPEIAEMLGWKDMEKLAMRSRIIKATIDSCKLDNPGDSQAQTLQLLGIWVEKQGRDSSHKLISELYDIGKRGKAQNVIGILNSGSV